VKLKLQKILDSSHFAKLNSQSGTELASVCYIYFKRKEKKI